MTPGSSSQGGAVLIGGGGHGVVVAEAARVGGIALAGFLDDDPDAPLKEHLRKLGKISGLDYPDMLRHHDVILTIGDIATRRTLIGRLADDLVTVIHPTAWVSPSAVVAGGVFVGPHAVVNSHASVAPHAIINSGAIIEHHCSIGENTHIAPGVALGGETRIGSDTLIGVGARTIPGVSVGARCAVGAGSVVISNVAEGETVMGVPAVAVTK